MTKRTATEETTTEEEAAGAKNMSYMKHVVIKKVTDRAAAVACFILSLFYTQNLDKTKGKTGDI